MKNRRVFIKEALTAAAGCSLIPNVIFSQSNEKLNKDLVFEFVKAGHNDLEKVKQLLKDHPALINASWDWSNGDFETAIGGAGHVGNVEIAEYLINRGARASLFTFTMLGKAEIVIPALEAYPDLIYSKGPHGFTLLHHANVGGKRSEEIKNYLIEKGFSETKVSIQ